MGSTFTHDVAQKLPNGLGLYDVHGDVYEWCQDWYNAYPTTLAVDPQGPASGFLRVFCGGSWVYSGQFCRSAGRCVLDPTLPENFVGFCFVAAQALSAPAAHLTSFGVHFTARAGFMPRLAWSGVEARRPVLFGAC